MIKLLVRSQFVVTSRKQTCKQILRNLQKYKNLCDVLNHDIGSRCVTVPPMLGVDKNMRNWSFFMILEHNSIVNKSITAIVQQLVRDEPLHGAAAINPKTEVMPSMSAGKEQLRLFEQSVETHLQVVEGLGKLRGTRTKPHPLFGSFDAHKWHCMLPFHLKIHYPQAKFVIRTANKR